MNESSLARVLLRLQQQRVDVAHPERCRPYKKKTSTKRPSTSAMFGGGPAAARGVPAWRTAIPRMRSAPRWIAGASGTDWRNALSLKWAAGIATGGNRKGTAERAIRW